MKNYRKTKLSYLALIIVFSLGGCITDGDDSEVIGESCSEGDFILTGTVDGKDLDFRETANGHMLSNFGSSEFQGFSGEGSSVSLEWSGSISNDQETEANGSIFLSSSVDGINDICVKSAKFVIVDDGVKFKLTELVKGDCASTETLTGEISGCVSM